MGRILMAIGLIILLGLLYFGGKAFLTTTGVINKVSNPDAIITNYEEFENMYETCYKLCDDIRALNNANVDSTAGFSKNERLYNLELQLNRWIREYNAKSNQITRSVWKSRDLPYQLERNEFNCK